MRGLLPFAALAIIGLVTPAHAQVENAEAQAEAGETEPAAESETEEAVLATPRRYNRFTEWQQSRAQATADETAAPSVIRPCASAERVTTGQSGEPLPGGFDSPLLTTTQPGACNTEQNTQFRLTRPATPAAGDGSEFRTLRSNEDVQSRIAAREAARENDLPPNCERTPTGISCRTVTGTSEEARERVAEMLDDD